MRFQMRGICQGSLIIILLIKLIDCQKQFPTFGEYVKKFGKKYEEKEYHERKNIYDQNILSLLNITEYEPGINNMSDLKPQQISARANLQILAQRKIIAKQFPTNIVKVGNPSSLDWRTKGVIAPVRDQAECGACWAFATAAYAESLLLIQQRFNKQIDLSQKYLLQCTPLSYCSGGFLEYGMAIGLSMPLQVTYPFNQKNQDPDICSRKRINIAKYSNNYYNLTDSQIIILLQESPLAVSIASKNWHQYGKGVFSCPPDSQINHAVLLVGYTSNYWIVKNQWGTGWGIDGFMYISRAKQKNCQMGYSVHTMKQEGNRQNDESFIELMKGGNIQETVPHLQNEEKVKNSNQVLKMQWLIFAFSFLLFQV